MHLFNICFFFLLVFVAVKVITVFLDICKYKKKERQLNQLVQLYHILEKNERGISIESQNLPAGIVVEEKWLYTKNFFFDVSDTRLALKKVEQYLTELMSFFLMYDYNQNRKTFRFLVEFKRELNISTGI